jgi:hypothetical protein
MRNEQYVGEGPTLSCLHTACDSILISNGVPLSKQQPQKRRLWHETVARVSKPDNLLVDFGKSTDILYKENVL